MKASHFQLGLFLVSLGAVAVVSWFVFSKAEYSRVDPIGPLPSVEESLEVLPLPDSSPILGERNKFERQEHHGLRRGIVRSTGGLPLEGARVTWLSLQRNDRESTSLLPMADLGPRDRQGVDSKTDADGFFEFHEPLPGSPYGAVLIAIHSGHHPAGLDLLGDPMEWPTSPEIVLEPAMPITVAVVDSAGTPLAGAVVHHAGKFGKPGKGDLPESIYERFFTQEGVTGADGRVSLARFRGEQVVWAEKDKRVSIPWEGHASMVVLTLGESFTIGGMVTSLGPESWRQEGEQRIVVSGLTGNLWRPLMTLRDLSQGDWGPVRVPLEGVSRYRVRLEGAPVIPVEESFDRPEDSSHQRIDLVAARGVGLRILVQNELGEAITTAHASAWWEPGMHPNMSIVGSARRNGEIYLGTFPPGWIRYSVAAPGYATEDLEGEALDTVSTVVTLHKGGSISGQCVHDEKPVVDFEVIYWKAGSIPVYRSQCFFGRENGRFEIESLVPGDWSIHAASPAFPCGEPLTVSVSAGRDTQVQLVLPTAIRGAGRVVSADTGEPVPNAHVQPYSSAGLERSLPWGPGILTAQDGSFDADAFALGNNYLTVKAEGWAMAEAEATAIDGDFLDWGDIRLVRPQSLEVRLLGLEQLSGVGPEDFRAGSEQGYVIPAKSFDRDGIARFDDVPPGDLRLLVYYPDGSWARLQLQLDSGKKWNFDLKAAGNRRLSIHVVDAHGHAPSYVPRVFLSAQEETGVFVVRQDFGEEGSASFQGIRSSQAQVWVFDPSDNIVATADVFFDSELTKEIKIRVGEKPFRVHVVGANSAPISGAFVTIRSATGVEIKGVGNTGSDGWAELIGLPGEALLMDVQHGILGRCFGVPIDASIEELEFVLEASGTLKLELADGAEPLAGVTTRIETTAGLTLGDARQTDNSGQVSYEALGKGTYHLACRRADCWPAFVDEDLSPGEHARIQVQMRRLANLEFSLFTAEGVPVSGAAVEITSEEFDMPIDTWILEEKIHAPGGLTTDRSGSIRVEGLPRGAYDWSLTVAGQPIAGSFELAPAQDNKVPAFLPH